MGTLVGHVAPGLGFFFLGLWHFIKHIERNSLQPNSYTSIPWFPIPKLRYLELYLIMVASSASIAMELVIGPAKHHPFSPDGTIPSNHLHNLEHASISLSFLVYAVCAIILDRIDSKSRYQLTQFIASIGFGLQLLLFYLHSTDHTGVEGQYHLFLQLVILISLTTTLLGIGFPNSFLISYVRSVSILFQGVWLIVMGIMLWTPSLIPIGCFLHMEEGHQVVQCGSDEALHRAKALVNIEFSWFVIGITIFSVCLYMCLVKLYGEKIEYWTIGEDDLNEVEMQSKFEESKSFIHMGKAFAPRDDIGR